jgi:hypothetical protein
MANGAAIQGVCAWVHRPLSDWFVTCLAAANSMPPAVPPMCGCPQLRSRLRSIVAAVALTLPIIMVGARASSVAGGGAAQFEVDPLGGAAGQVGEVTPGPVLPCPCMCHLCDCECECACV